MSEKALKQAASSVNRNQQMAKTSYQNLHPNRTHNFLDIMKIHYKDKLQHHLESKEIGLT